MPDQTEEFPGPEELTPFHRINVLIIKVKTGEGDMRSTQLVCSKDRPVPISKTAEVMDIRKRGGLRCPDNFSCKAGHPVFQERYVVPVGVDHNDGPLVVQLDKAVRG